MSKQTRELIKTYKSVNPTKRRVEVIQIVRTQDGRYEYAFDGCRHDSVETLEQAEKQIRFHFKTGFAFTAQAEEVIYATADQK